MLRGLSVRDMLLIDRLDLDLRPGLNVLTGETGAGKSILLDSLGFVLGWRGRAELVRQGAERGEVVAEFDLDDGHPARAVLEDTGFQLEPGEPLILRRVNTPDGRKTAWVNDRRASGEALRRISETLVELHGQHDDRGLLDARGHRRLLDAFAGADLALSAARAAWSAKSAAARQLSAAEAALETARAEEDFLRHAVTELDALDPDPGEEAALDTRRRQMQAAERVRGDLARAQAAMGWEGAEGLLTDAARWLDGAAGDVGDAGDLEAVSAALLRAMDELAGAEQGLGRVLEAMEFDPHELERIEERLFAIRGLARKYEVLPDDLGAHAAALRDRLAALDAGEGDLAALRRALAEADRAYDVAAGALTDLRRDAAGRLDAAMAGELGQLKMERAVFSTGIAPGTPGPDGRDAVEFTVATNPGAPPGPLGRIASGGELSRFLLALKVCLTGTSRGLTLIFDEIDRGVGGATADAVGRRLAALAESAQVLVVTHSPQVAARGAHHWRVEKRVAEGMTTSTVTPLDEAARIDEIARMLAGDIVTDEARGAARSLLG
ncbi:DNA repair protein RecN [Palleronia rufa]|uniref:DNA repair protein RecN n=2 Tax=Palleronia rufa TaxID=1530186 RepID=UPI00055B7ADB|nr:DNA repair protein RecN [Palleronia rufa]